MFNCKLLWIWVNVFHLQGTHYKYFRSPERHPAKMTIRCKKMHLLRHSKCILKIWLNMTFFMTMSHPFCNWFHIKNMLTPKKRTLLRVNNQMRIIMPHWLLRMLLIWCVSTFVLTGNLNADEGCTFKNSTTLILFYNSRQCMDGDIILV